MNNASTTRGGSLNHPNAVGNAHAMEPAATSLDLARSALFVPASRPDRFDKALATGADAVIIDLEDAVLPDDKATAREALSAWLAASPGHQVVVRVNAVDTDWAEADLAMCRRHANVAAVLLPKADSAEIVAHAAGFGKPLWPIIESAAALVNLAAVAASPGVRRLAFGSLDLGLDLDLDPDSAAAATILDQGRYAVLLHGRVAGLAAPLDGVHPAIRDLEGLAVSAGRARDMGFGGALCIHPTHVRVLNDSFLPTPAQREWARRVLERAASESGAFQLDGKMVDAPVIKRAQRLAQRGAQANAN
ncbi:(S)-citramalyl-CoA lyase [Pigmentiphaga litoralis]|uniref:(S)-citramalyl-CoA lyase n=2 Tax=Pigmentiphaga litoralis TaxID=516702 RepID=A0A7Y9IUE2_9BURK|nr:(S)-citramalyl-CoA lyase [Pigmentiphaga litoralis]NYE83133.1 (S)-citramalyl-CoA lyase [Pigmentiphaga litoralis]